MREIKFRGLTKGGSWVYGDLIQTKPNKVDGGFTCWIKERGFLGLGAISTPTAAFVAVETKTVGQFIGLTDKNGVEIYEGGIFYDGINNNVIKWIDDNASFAAFDGTENHELGSYLANEAIIGNVHQNPELLEQNDE